MVEFVPPLAEIVGRDKGLGMKIYWISGRPAFWGICAVVMGLMKIVI